MSSKNSVPILNLHPGCHVAMDLQNNSGVAVYVDADQRSLDTLDNVSQLPQSGLIFQPNMQLPYRAEDMSGVLYARSVGGDGHIDVITYAKDGN